MSYAVVFLQLGFTRQTPSEGYSVRHAWYLAHPSLVTEASSHRAPEPKFLPNSQIVPDAETLAVLRVVKSYFMLHPFSILRTIS